MPWTLAQIKTNITTFVRNATRTSKIDKDDLANVLEQNAEFVDERVNGAMANTVVTANATAHVLPKRATSGVGYVDTTLSERANGEVFFGKSVRQMRSLVDTMGAQSWYYLGRVYFQSTYISSQGGVCVVELDGGGGSFNRGDYQAVGSAKLIIRSGPHTTPGGASNAMAIFSNRGKEVLIGVKMVAVGASDLSSWNWDVYLLVAPLTGRMAVRITADEDTRVEVAASWQKNHANQITVSDPGSAANVVTGMNLEQLGSTTLVRDRNLIIGAWGDQDTATSHRLQNNGTTRLKRYVDLENEASHPGAPSAGVRVYAFNGQYWAHRAGAGSPQQLTS